MICVDIDEKKIKALKNGKIPIFEPGLDEIVKRKTNVERLTFFTSLKEVLDDVSVVFSSVGPSSSTEETS